MATTRSYDSRTRRERARQTRSRILEAARTEFLADGYATATIARVAGRAGVSVDLVYKSFDGKIGLLKELLDITVGGDDDDVAMLDRPGPARLRLETDPRRQVEMLATGVTDQLERLRPMDAILRSAAAADPDAAALRRDVQERQRKLAMRTFTGWILARVNPDVRPAGALVDAVWVLTSPETHDMLRGSCRWSRSAYQQWLTRMLAATLLAPTTDSVSE